MPLLTDAVTGHSPFGNTGIPYGAFTGKTPQPEPEVDDAVFTGGFGQSRRRRRRADRDPFNEAYRSSRERLESDRAAAEPRAEVAAAAPDPKQEQGISDRDVQLRILAALEAAEAERESLTLARRRAAAVLLML